MIPALAGFPLGLLQNSPMTPDYQAIVDIMLLGFVFVSIVSVFESRFYYTCEYSQHSSWKKIRVFWLLGHYLYISLVYYFAVLVPEQSSARQEVFKRLPCLTNYIYENLFVLSLNCLFHLITIGAFILSITIESVVFMALMLKDIAAKLKNHTMSRQTFLMQKRCFRAVFIQMTLPLTMLVIPAIYYGFSIVTNYYNQAGNNLVIIGLSTHGLMSTVVMLITHRPYRTAILRPFEKKFER